MRKSNLRKYLVGGAAAGAIALALGAPAWGQEATYDFNQPSMEMAAAIQAVGHQTGANILVDSRLVSGLRSPELRGELSTDQALLALLDGTGLTVQRTDKNSILIRNASDPQSGSAAGDGADGTVQALVVTAQKREENIQDVPIAMSAFTQEALERSQVAGGPDLMTQVPNMTFTKTNFSSYSIQLRGIGTQAISATTDAAVAVAFNNTPFIRNRFFEQEFYDLQRVEVLRGPQGTLYGRNATAGVVNIISQKPKFTYEAKLSADVANYKSIRLEGMLNVPLVEDKVALRVAGAWTKRDGYDTNQITGNQIDGRDLWSTRVSLRFAPTDAIEANLIWEHFQEEDDRLRSGKQLCHQDDRAVVSGLTVDWNPFNGYSNSLSQGCLAASLYSPDSFEAPNGYSLPYYLPLAQLNLPITPGFNPYSSLVQSPDLRMIESTVDPKYKANSDLVELQWKVDFNNGLTLSSETGYNYDTIFSLEDYNRFNTASGAFAESGNFTHRPGYMREGPNGWVFCDPQVGCADRVVAVDVSRAKSSQFSQEFRLSSDFEGPLNFSLGANFLRYDTEDKYYVFINTLTMFAAAGGYQVFGDLTPWQPGVSDNHECLYQGAVTPDPHGYLLMSGCIYIDPNSIENVNDLGHNYFLSKNPYKLISYAVFGEAYYQLAENLKLTAGLRWTVDKKEAPRFPSWLIGSNTVGSSPLEVQDQEWREPTGRLTLDWKPNLSFTDETLLYGSFSHGYKAGGANPPPSGVVAWSLVGFNGNGSPTGESLAGQTATKPKTFDPEFVNAFEIGAKNTLLDGTLTLNGDIFYYDYTGYQVSQIIDRSAVNYNFDSRIWGVELEADWRPLENLRLGFKGGYEKTRIADHQHAIDIMDRTAGHDDWVVYRPFPSFPSNCVLPAYVVDPDGDGAASVWANGGNMGVCEFAYALNTDPITGQSYDSTDAPTSPPDPNMPNYPGFNPLHDYGANHGEGFDKELGGNELPNAPHFTATVTADYTLPLPRNWFMTLHTDLYYQSEAWTRVFNTPGYDKLKAYTNVNLAAIFTNEDAGWKVMAYIKNVMDRDSITGAFLNSDDTGLTTNVFLTEPRLYGLRVTKDFTGNGWWTGANPDHPAGEPYPLTVEIGGQVERLDAPYASVAPSFNSAFSDALDPTHTQHRDLDWGDGRELRINYKPAGSAWSAAVGVRYGRSNSGTSRLHTTEKAGPPVCMVDPEGPFGGVCDPNDDKYTDYFTQTGINWSDSSAQEREDHLMADFVVGHDLGIGGLSSQSKVTAGLRYAQFRSHTAATLDGVPNLELFVPFAYGPATFTHYGATLEAEREFKGAGPALSWDGGWRLWGDEQVGHVNLDGSVGGGVLFGKQTTRIEGTQGSSDISNKYGNFFGGVLPPLETTPVNIARANSVTAPFVDVSLGLSYEIQRIKVGAGYRWERYYNVLDAGYAKHQDYDRTIDGPYFKIAVGFGG